MCIRDRIFNVTVKSILFVPVKYFMLLLRKVLATSSLFFACVTLIIGLVSQLEFTQFKRLREITCYENTLEVLQQR